jgi:hypothetical protein
MALLALPIICFFFLVVGALVFMVCVALPPLRRFALSAALWCAVWGPCVIASMLLAGMVVVAGHIGLEHIDSDHLKLPQWRAGFGIGLLWLAALATASAATVVAWLHQVVVRRMTFALFRIYAAIVTAGIGSVWGWALGIWIGSQGGNLNWALWLAAMGLLVGGFGYGGFRWAKQLRGHAPHRLAWVTPEEFEGL